MRILIVEDHPIARVGIRNLVEQEPDMEVVAEANHGTLAVARFRDHRPDVVLMDLRMPELDGIAATAAIKRVDPAARILVLSSYDTVDEVRRVLDAGAAGYITKEADPAEILNALRAVHGGATYVPPAIAARLDALQDEGSLNGRERQILALMAQGLSNRQIGAQISLSSGTVRIYVSRILAKLGVSNRAEAVASGIERGVLLRKGP